MTTTQNIIPFQWKDNLKKEKKKHTKMAHRFGIKVHLTWTTSTTITIKSET
jgi:hypothetical protein